MMTNQAEAQVRFGGGVAYGFDIEEIAISANALVGLNEKLAIQPSFNYYFVGEGVTFWELNGDLHYSLTGSETLDLYALGGISIVRTAIEAVIFGVPFSVSDTVIGLNLGVGANFGSGGNITPFGELKYTVGDASQLVLSAGIRF